MSLPGAIGLYFDWTVQERRKQRRAFMLGEHLGIRPAVVQPEGWRPAHQEPPARPADSGRLAKTPGPLGTTGSSTELTESRQSSPEAE